tara:strand:+ start:373 stop:555 length:183 start_codon:yes stop_codon:yes gene_type:complete
LLELEEDELEEDELEDDFDDKLDIFLVVCLCGTIVKYENMFNIYRIFGVVVGKTIWNNTV